MANHQISVTVKVLDHASKQLKALNKIVGQTGKIIRKTWLPATAAAAVGIYAIKKSMSALIDTSSQIEQLKIRLTGLLGSVEEGNRVFEDMSELAGQVPKTYDEIMESATSLAAVVRGGSQEVKQLMPVIVDLSAATGISVRDVTSQMIRMYSAGAASADMFRERGTLAMLGFKASVSYTAKETMEQVIEAWKSAETKFGGAAKKLAKTWDGQCSMMSDAWFQFKAGVGKKMFETIKKDMGAVLLLLEKSKEEGGEYAQTVKVLSRSFAEAYESSKDMMVTLVVGIGHAVDGFNEVMLVVAKVRTIIQMAAIGVQKLGIGLVKASTMGLGSTEQLEAALTDMEATLVKSLEREYELQKKANVDYSDLLVKKIEMFQEALGKMRTLKEEEAAAEEEQPGIVPSPKTEQEKLDAIYEAMEEATRLSVEASIKSEAEKINAARGMWLAWSDEKLEKVMGDLQRETEMYKFLQDTQKKAHESIWVSAGKLRDQFSSGVSKMLGNLIKGTFDAKKAFTDLGLSMLQTLIDYGVQLVVNNTIAKGLEAMNIASAVASGAAIASAYAPAAAAVSLASYGANAGPAAAGMTSVHALSQSLAIPRMEEGGIIRGSQHGTLLIAGEKNKSEAIVPLSKGSRIGRSSYRDVVINIENANFRSEEDIEDVADTIVHLMDERQRSKF